MNPVSINAPTRSSPNQISETESQTLGQETVPDSYGVSAPATPLPLFLVPLFWSPSAEAANPASVEIISKNGTYTNGKFTGKIRAKMILPDLEKTLRICTGEDLSSYQKFPGIREASYNGGVLKYVLATPDLGFISVRDFGYALSTAIDRSQESSGTVTATWSNSGIQPATDKAGNPLTNFLQNNGGWIFKKLPEGENVYEVTWYVSTLVNPESLQSGSGMIPDATIAAQSLKDAETVVRTLAKLSTSI